jgi:DNA-binding NarL/FixJ family response regulator
MLIEHNARFRQGLAVCLTEAGFEIVLEAESIRGALRVLEQWHQQRTIAPIPLDLMIVSLDLPPDSTAAIALCQTLRQTYPALPLLTMSEAKTPAIVTAAYQVGAMGYCQKSTVIADWRIAIRQIVGGQSYWVQGMDAIAQTTALLPSGGTPSSAPVVYPLAPLKRRVRQSGLAQIEAAIADINAQLQNPTLSPLEQLFLTGRRRELRASRWLVNRLLSTPSLTASASLPPQPPPSPPPAPSPSSAPPAALVPQPQTTAIRSIQASLWDTTFAKLQLGLRNLTDSPLEIDILRDDRKRDLLEIVLRQVEAVVTDLRVSQLSVIQLADKQALILVEIWRAATIDFLGRYTTLPIGDTPTDPLNQQPVEIVDVLLQDAAIVQSEILSRIPMVPDFLAHLLFQEPLMVDETSYAIGSVEAMSRMEALLQNLVIQVGNAVMQPLLNRFGNVVAVKQNFYDRRLLSTREIERFRNNLSWRYRVQRYFKEPTAIFESRYSLLVFAELGIVKASIYSPRNQELDDLAGIGLAVTLALEARDAISPRLRSAISFVGSGVVYVLTEVIGRGIGLIGRGIIKGVGNVVQDPTIKRNSQR